MTHTRQAFDHQIYELEQNVVRLGAVVEEMLEIAMQSVLTQNAALVVQTVRQDDIADALDLEIEQHCVRLLALQQPLSRDLRMITTVIKIIADLERVGDYSVDIAKTGERMIGMTPYNPPEKLSKIGECAQRLIHDTLRAFVDRDLELARQCIKCDDEIDDLHDQLFEEMLTFMQQQPEMARQATRFLLISRYLERIADHCTNIAERLSYMVTGHLEEMKVKEEDRVIG